MTKTNYDWIVAENSLSAFRCERCHDRYVVGLPCGFDMMLAMMKSFQESHKDCKAPDDKVTIIDTSIKDLESIADCNLYTTVAIRKINGILQSEVAKAMGKSRATVVAIEQGESKSIFWAYRLHVHGLIAKVQVTEEAKKEMATCPGGIHCGPCQKCLSSHKMKPRDVPCGYSCPKHNLGITHLNREELEKTFKKYLQER